MLMRVAAVAVACWGHAMPPAHRLSDLALADHEVLYRLGVNLFTSSELCRTVGEEYAQQKRLLMVVVVECVEELCDRLTELRGDADDVVLAEQISALLVGVRDRLIGCRCRSSTSSWSGWPR
ncbi:hypothetical protein GCM10012275_42530 [Longimycelium tulufanense]|uniref:Uncharacterized protein n=1 Tax=Longimycelium tulufanense TaxID=907463 RepID=A0A8J3FWL5_9PSEU|nr:hypothetical protein [Longimycelium tulufanense]GGM67430.1 hypothetical protein GCM10012275_42530 [Longimycelium tulufanense]